MDCGQQHTVFWPCSILGEDGHRNANAKVWRAIHMQAILCVCLDFSKLEQIFPCTYLAHVHQTIEPIP